MLLNPEVLARRRESLALALEEGETDEAARISGELSAVRVASLLSEAPMGSIVPTLRKLEPARAGAVLGHFTPALAAEVLETLETDEAAGLLELVPPDEATDIFSALEEEEGEWADEVLAQVSSELRVRIQDLARYPEGTAGSVMKPHFVAIRSGTSVGAALEALRTAPPEVERAPYVYIVDGENRPRGVISLRDLILAPVDRSVDQVMVPDLVVVRAEDPVLDAARLLRSRRLKLLPVLGERGVLVGVISVDDAYEVLTEEATRSFVEFGAASPDESFFTPPMGAVQKRLPWMAVNIFLNLGAVAVIASFEDTIAQIAILAAFLPMITDMGGNVGIQALSVAIRSIALEEARIRDFWRAIRKEVAIGLVNGIALGALFAGIAYLLQQNVVLGVVAGAALGVNVLVAGIVGGGLPFLIKRIGKDPAMMTGPILTTITDITGVSIYLGMSTIFLTQILG